MDKQRTQAIINSVWLVLLVPALGFYALWFSDRSYSYTWVTDIDAHAANFVAKVLPTHDSNRTQLILQGFKKAILEPSLHHRRVSLAAHTWMAGTTAIAMMLNLMPWVRTRSYTLHKMLGYYVVAVLPVMMTQLAVIWTVFGQVPVGFVAWISTPIMLTEMAVSLYIGYKAAVARQWMKHRAAMIFCTAAITYIPVQRFLWTVFSKTKVAQNDLPHPVSSWEEHRDVILNITTSAAMVVNNLVASYFAFCTVPRDARVQAKLTKAN